MGGFLIFVGLIALLIGIISLIKPLHFLRITTRKLGAVVLVSGFVILIVGVSLSSADDKPVAEPQEVAEEEVEPEPEPEPAPEPEPEPEEVVEEDPIEEEKSNEVTLGEKNALSSALNYLAVMPFSHSGLVKQLEFEGYTNEEAVYAADNCGADWNEQALKSALNYLATMPFSKSGLVEQLKFEGFTNDQAVYGVDNCEADWNEQAALKAQVYLDTMSFSRDGLIAQLEFEGFTRQQAEYGVKAVGY